MPSSGPNGDSKKHRSHLRLLETMMQESVPQRLQDARTMADGFAILRSYPMIGNFLAYQFVTDLNYSDLTDYSEREFVVAGPGAMDGLKKCFPGMAASDASTLIRFMCDHQETFQEALGLRPVTLCGKTPLRWPNSSRLILPRIAELESADSATSSGSHPLPMDDAA